MKSWNNIPKNIEEYFGFTYLITNLVDGRLYIGRKFFKKKQTKPPLKGRKNRRISYIESDWKDYYGSSPELQKDLDKLGKDKFKREVLNCYKTKWEVIYHEAREIFARDAIIDDKYYNQWINIKLRKLSRRT